MSLSAVVGHTRIVGLLKQAVARDSVPQSLLFAGPEGVGKRTTAVALAQAVNCPTPIAPASDDGPPAMQDGCGVCRTCTRIARGQHSDVVLIDRGDEASIKIRVLRERLLDLVGYRPFEARRNVYIIDGADDLTEEAQDALLKTLEEPPASAILILVTAFPDTLHATIQSRCRRLRFGPLTEHEVAEVLKRLHDKKAVTAAERGLAAASGGSVSRVLGAEPRQIANDLEAALDLVTAATHKHVAARLSAAAELASNKSNRRDREALAARLAAAASLVRDLTAIRSGDARLPLANADKADRLHDVVRAFDTDRLSAAYDTITKALVALDTNNASPKLVADWVAVNL
jgi:DNA polymerase-3 subunit delta'